MYVYIYIYIYIYMCVCVCVCVCVCARARARAHIVCSDHAKVKIYSFGQNSVKWYKSVEYKILGVKNSCLECGSAQ